MYRIINGTVPVYYVYKVVYYEPNEFTHIKSYELITPDKYPEDGVYNEESLSEAIWYARGIEAKHKFETVIIKMIPRKMIFSNEEAYDIMEMKT